MRRSAAAVRCGIAATILLLVAACGTGGGGGSGEATAPPGVLISPSTVTVIKGEPVRFAAQVYGAGPTVIWSVDGGDANGTFEADGLYRAPAAVVEAPIIIRATSADDARGIGTAIVRVTAGAALTRGVNQAVSPQGALASTLSGGQRSIAVAGVNVYVVWSDNSLGTDDVYLAVSRDRGIRFSNPIRINDVIAGPQRVPSVAAMPDGRVVVAWMDGRRYEASSSERFDVYAAVVTMASDGTIQVGPNQAVAEPEPGTQQDPMVALAVDSAGRAYFGWIQDASGGSEVWILRSAFNAVGSLMNRTLPEAVGPVSDAYQMRPSIAVTPAGEFVVAWTEDHVSAPHDVYWRGGRYASTGEIQWGPSVVRVNVVTEGSQVSPSVAVDDRGAAYVAWTQELVSASGRRRLFFARSTLAEHLAVMANQELVSDAEQNFASLVVRGEEVTIAFGDNRRCQPVCSGTGPEGIGETDIRMIRSLDGGTTFVDVMTDGGSLNDDAFPAQHGRPSVAVDEAGRAYVVWADSRAGADTSQAYAMRAE